MANHQRLRKSGPTPQKNFSISKPNLEMILCYLLTAWFLSAFLEYLFLPEALLGLESLQGLAAMSLVRLLILTVLFAAILWLISCYRHTFAWERLAVPCSFLLLMATGLYRLNNDLFLVLCLIILAAMLVYAFWGHQKITAEPKPGKKAQWYYLVIVGVAAVSFAVFVSYWTVCRVIGYYTPAFDFGIFAQMFHNMKETGLPITTIERGQALSHFAVHVSPIYYLMLPFYCLYPHPATLQVLQAVVLASAVIPMWLIGKRHGLHPLLRTLLCIVLLLLPTTAAGTSYDIHENCFLLPLVLWLMYAIDRNSIWMVALMGALTLMIKEDAAVYVAVAALYLLLRSGLNYKKAGLKPLLIGAGLFLLAILWFLAVTSYLNTKGTGVMSSRYNNLDYEKSGSLITVIKAVILSPMKTIYECATPEKWEFIGLTMLPLLCMPLITRKFERYVLLIPYVLVNLISDYQYQHNIFFQYTFGSTAFLLYLTAVNLADINWGLARFIPTVLMVVLCFSMFAQEILPEARPAIENYKKNKAYCQTVTDALETIPKDASVAAHSFYVTPLSDRKVLFDLHTYCTKEDILSCEYVVLSQKCKSKFYDEDGINDDFANREALIPFLQENGYEIVHQGGAAVIYRKMQTP